MGGVKLSQFFLDGGVVLVYVKPEGFNTYSEWKITPHIFELQTDFSDYIGVRIGYSASRGYFIITKTTNGWNAESISESEIPAKIDFRVVLIEASVFAQTKGKINFLNYTEVKNHFKL